MIAPKFLYSCDHNLIEYGERKKTIIVTRNTVTIDNSEPNNVFITGLKDVISLPGKFKRIEKVYYSGSIETDSFEMSGEQGLAFFENIDYSVSDNGMGNIITILWKDRRPPDRESYSVDIVYDAHFDVDYSIEKREFYHVQEHDIVKDIDTDANVLFIECNKKIFTIGKDFVTNLLLDYQASQYNLEILWKTQVPSREMILVYSLENETVENDYSNGTTVNNEDENLRTTLFAQDNRCCPRCNGTGWYVGLFEKNSHRAKSVNRLLQEFLKLFYTTSSDEGIYLLNLPGQKNIQSEEWVKSVIESVVLNSVNRYCEMISEAMSKGKNISESEKIYSAGVSDVVVYDDFAGVEAKVTIVTMAGQSLSLPVDII